MVNPPADLPPEGRFAGREHRFPVRVYFEDTDLSGVVYHANYLRYMERARSDMLRRAGIDQRAAWEDGRGAYAISECTIRYRAPARLDDALVVVSRLVAYGAASCRIHQRVRRDTLLLADASVVAAFVAPSGRPVRQPRQWLDVFESLIAAEEDDP
ncbi:acyl-CoA thioester hydrolase [Hephaestia caeni]|uniref:Acyl-CoA thioester hydrolase n=1 Tax=Hephaestia caeni TaxID=645617 RepID=A0A397P514_9SPHN|nr:YbgC/FadM family acyl-CoA thioesterase [Hephaestia caeni]RIA44646.1 acyl-CoA thioester hydrolase [Hephaestia caeni]